jgi:hypothetical protein
MKLFLNLYNASYFYNLTIGNVKSAHYQAIFLISALISANFVFLIWFICLIVGLSCKELFVEQFIEIVLSINSLVFLVTILFVKRYRWKDKAHFEDNHLSAFRYSIWNWIYIALSSISFLLMIFLVLKH